MKQTLMLVLLTLTGCTHVDDYFSTHNCSEDCGLVKYTTMEHVDFGVMGNQHHNVADTTILTDSAGNKYVSKWVVIGIDKGETVGLCSKTVMPYSTFMARFHGYAEVEEVPGTPWWVWTLLVAVGTALCFVISIQYLPRRKDHDV